MKLIQNETFDQERALYGSREVHIENCRFDGPADGESAIKECRSIEATDCYFNLRYPFWHCDGVKIRNARLTELCRAALWYTENLEITGSQLHGIKALRECGGVTMTDCDVISEEFGWFTRGISMKNCAVQGAYFMLRSNGLRFDGVKLKGKYSFQYIENSTFENCDFDTKDAFWHAKNVTVRNSTLKGEYLAWYCENVTFENCRIIGTQPLCYCKNLKLIDCEMVDTDLSFERSQVEATLTAPVLSIKNPRTGYILAPAGSPLIFDDPEAKGIVLDAGNDCKNARRILGAGDHTCVLCQDTHVSTSRDRGVKPLLALVGRQFSGFSAADKVVGKATAYLYCLLGIRYLWAQVLSQPALEVLEQAGIAVEYETLVPHIVSRTDDGICPFEAAVAQADSPQAALELIQAKAVQLHI